MGVVAKLLMKGRDPGGMIVTIFLGIGGALVGGFVGRMLDGTEKAIRLALLWLSWEQSWCYFSLASSTVRLGSEMCPRLDEGLIIWALPIKRR